MAAANASPVDTATGQIESEQVNIHSNTSRIHGARQTFRRRYAHYIDSNNNEATYTARPNFIGVQPVSEFRDGCSSIPYQNLGMAFSPTQFAQLTAIATELKVHSLGYEIKKITVLQENLTTRAQGTTLENTFQSRPSVLLFNDGQHMLDEVVGIAELTTHGNYTGLNDSRPRMEVALQNLPSMCLNFNNNATIGDAAKTYPGSQTDGALPEVSWYLRSGEGDVAHVPWFLDDILDPVVLGEGEKHSFIWKNPTPHWHKNGQHPYQTVYQSNGTANLTTREGYWPSQRYEALKTYYKGSLFDHTADNAYDSTGTTSTAAERAGLGTKGSVVWSGDSVPPFNYIKMPPLWGPTSKMNFTTEIWVEYTADIEWSTSGLLPYMNRPWPAASVMTNAISSFPAGFSDLRRRFGTAQASSSVGFNRREHLNRIGGEEEEDEEERGPKRRRFDDNEI